jgi:hypothetical protein
MSLPKGLQSRKIAPAVAAPPTMPGPNCQLIAAAGCWTYNGITNGSDHITTKINGPPVLEAVFNNARCHESRSRVAVNVRSQETYPTTPTAKCELETTQAVCRHFCIRVEDFVMATRSESVQQN